MADVPRDPRQLARDILAGKIRIEDLQRERQMRQGGAAPRPAERVPLPRPVPPRPAPPQARPPAQRPLARPAQMPRPQQRPASVPQVRPPQRPPQFTIPAPPPPAPPPVLQEEAPPQVSRDSKVARPLRLKELARSRHALRQGVLLSEVLGKPVGLRDSF